MIYVFLKVPTPGINTDLTDGHTIISACGDSYDKESESSTEQCNILRPITPVKLCAQAFPSPNGILLQYYTDSTGVNPTYETKQFLNIAWTNALGFFLTKLDSLNNLKDCYKYNIEVLKMLSALDSTKDITHVKYILDSLLNNNLLDTDIKDDVLWQSGEIAERMGNYSNADSIYKKILLNNSPSDSMYVKWRVMYMNSIKSDSMGFVINDSLMLNYKNTFINDIRVKIDTNVVYYKKPIKESDKTYLGDSYLLQNSPNPFSGETEIEYFVNQESQVKFYITNLYGQKIKELVNRLEVGKKNLKIDLKDFSTGTYYYTLSIDGVEITRPMILIH